MSSNVQGLQGRTWQCIVCRHGKAKDQAQGSRDQQHNDCGCIAILCQAVPDACPWWRCLITQSVRLQFALGRGWLRWARQAALHPRSRRAGMLKHAHY